MFLSHVINRMVNYLPGNIAVSVKPDWSGSVELSAQSLQVNPTIQIQSADEDSTGATNTLRGLIQDKDSSSDQGSLQVWAPNGTLTLSMKNWFEL